MTRMEAQPQPTQVNSARSNWKRRLVFVASGLGVVGLAILVRYIVGTSSAEAQLSNPFRGNKPQQAARRSAGWRGCRYATSRRTASQRRAAASRAAEARCDGRRQRPGHPPRRAGVGLRRALRRGSAGRPGEQAAHHASLPESRHRGDQRGNRRRNRPHGRAVQDRPRAMARDARARARHQRGAVQARHPLADARPAEAARPISSTCPTSSFRRRTKRSSARP